MISRRFNFIWSSIVLNFWPLCSLGLMRPVLCSVNLSLKVEISMLFTYSAPKCFAIAWELYVFYLLNILDAYMNFTLCLWLCFSCYCFMIRYFNCFVTTSFFNSFSTRIENGSEQYTSDAWEREDDEFEFVGFGKYSGVSVLQSSFVRAKNLSSGDWWDLL